MDPELQAQIEDLAAFAKLLNQRIDTLAGTPTPTAVVVPQYLSGRWKLRDGTMYGR